MIAGNRICSRDVGVTLEPKGDGKLFGGVHLIYVAEGYVVVVAVKMENSPASAVNCRSGPYDLPLPKSRLVDCSSSLVVQFPVEQWECRDVITIGDPRSVAGLGPVVVSCVGIEVWQKMGKST